MKIHIIIYVALALISSSIANAYEKPYPDTRLAQAWDVWLFIGQSNTNGSSSGDTAFVTRIDDDAYIPLYKRSGNVPLIITQTIGTLSSQAAENAAGEYGFLRTLYSQGHRNVIGLKHAANGEGMFDWWLPGLDGYDDILVSIAKFEELVAPQQIRYRGIVWVQGYADAIETETIADAYLASITTFVAQLRLDLNTPDLIFISPEHPPDWSTATYGATIKTAITTYCASDPLAASYDVDDTTARDGGVHYGDGSTDGSLETVGVRAANAYLDNF